MAGIKDFFNNLFIKNNESTQREFSNNSFDYMPSLGQSFISRFSNAEENHAFTSAVDAIARNTAKLKPIHYINQGEGNEQLNRLLQLQPNPYQSTYDFLYKVVSTLYYDNNSYIYVARDDSGNLEALYPIKGQSVQFGLDDYGELLCKFTYKTGLEVFIPYAELIHLRRNYSKDELIGDNNNVISDLINVSDAQLKGTVKGIELGANLRGIVKYGTTLAPNTLKERKEEFTKQYLSLENSGGIVVTDSSLDYTPIDSKPYSISEGQINSINNQIYNYLGINSKIVSSDYNEDEFGAFHESVIEPLALQMSQEFTNKIFTDKELEYGNTIEFSSIGIQYSSMESKTRLLKEVMPMGLLTVNEARKLLNLPKLNDEEGNKRLQSLNYADTEIVNSYQLEGNTNLVNDSAGVANSISESTLGSNDKNKEGS